MDFLELSQKYTSFIYDAYTYEVRNDVLELTYHYELHSESERIPFTHRVFYSVKGNVNYDYHDIRSYENLIFHIGLIEVINYYKLACPKQIMIRCGTLDPDQVTWWKKLFYHGLGEFIYLNNMAALVTEESFVEFSSEIERQEGSDTKTDLSSNTDSPLVLNTKGHLIPIGGGKDSVVTLNVLRDYKEDNICFVMSPPQAAYDCIEVAGYKGYLEAKRIFDKRMIEMNNSGYLNGHVPFSAILAFISTLGAALVGKAYIPLSNERSANEPSVHGTTFNHQYSKSYEFELDFHRYASKYLTTSITYFSLLRPLYEIQIGEMFSHYKEYHEVYRSCNRGKSTNTWCGSCPKCLFVYIILAPFLEKEVLSGHFGKDLLEDESLIPILDELIGIKETKPFECVGTVWEVRAALNRCLVSRNNNTLIQYYKKINGPMLDAKPTDYETGDLLSDEHRNLLEKEMKCFDVMDYH